MKSIIGPDYTLAGAGTYRCAADTDLNARDLSSGSIGMHGGIGETEIRSSRHLFEGHRLHCRGEIIIYSRRHFVESLDCSRVAIFAFASDLHRAARMPASRAAAIDR